SLLMLALPLLRLISTTMHWALTAPSISVCLAVLPLQPRHCSKPSKRTVARATAPRMYHNRSQREHAGTEHQPKISASPAHPLIQENSPRQSTPCCQKNVS